MSEGYFHGKNFHFGKGTVFLSSGKEFPTLCIAKNRGEPGRPGELAMEDPEGVSLTDEENVIFVFHNRMGLRALMDHLREIDDTWSEKWPSQWPPEALSETPNDR
jgi:hypothetical protein